MKIPDYKVGTTFEITCAKIKRKFEGKESDEYVYDSFGIDKDHTYMWGRKPEQVIKVKATIIEEDVLMSKLYRHDSDYDCNKVDYFGWISFEKDELDIRMIWRNIKLYFMCFPYGPDAGRFWSQDMKDYKTYEIIHKAGDRKGMTVRLKIEEI